MHESGPVAGFRLDNAMAVANRDLNFNLVILSNTCYVDWCHKSCISPGFCLVGLLGCTSIENIKFNILWNGLNLPHYDNAHMQCSSEKANSFCKYNTYDDMCHQQCCLNTLQLFL